MNYIEEHGKKVAAVLCVASCFPVVAAVYAMETEPGWHGDRYINTDATVAKGWQEIEGKSYYFDETGEVDEETTQQATVATVSQDVAQNVQTNVTSAAKEVVTEEVKVVDEQKAAEEKAAQEAAAQQAQEETVAAEEAVTVVEDSTANVSQPVYTEETPVENTTQTPEASVTPPAQNTTAAEPTTPAAPEQTTTVETTTPAAPEQTTPPVSEQQPSTPEQTAPEQTPQAPAQETPAQPTTPPAQNTTQNNAAASNPYADLNNRISSAAQSLVGVTNGQQCTQVAQQALAMAGVSDAMQLWPDQYIQYGYYTDTPQAGNLVYYDNGGRGIDHIAIYIGNGMAVHGNYWTNGESQTVIASVYNGGGGSPQFIQVTR